MAHVRILGRRGKAFQPLQAMSRLKLEKMNRLYRKRSSLEKALGIGSYSMYFSGGWTPGGIRMDQGIAPGHKPLRRPSGIWTTRRKPFKAQDPFWYGTFPPVCSIGF
jgi:hypothetical protein